MDRIWQWAWDRYGARYSWAICVVALPVVLPIYLILSFVVVAFEESDRYVEAAAVTVVAVLVLVYVHASSRPGPRSALWSGGQPATRSIGRGHWTPPTPGLGGRLPGRVAGNAVWAAVLLVVVGAIAGASGSRLVQYGILGAVFGAAVQLIACAQLRGSSAAAGQGRHRR